MGRPASSKPFNCSKAFFAHSASANLKERSAQSEPTSEHDSPIKQQQLQVTDMKPYPLDRPVSLSIMSWIPSIFGNKTHQNR